MNEPTLPNDHEVRTYIKDIYVEGVALGASKTEFHTFMQNAIAELAHKFSLD